MAQNEHVKAIAAQLLGEGTVEELTSSSGVYGTLPYGDKPKTRDGCHVDSYLDSRQRLSAVAYSRTSNTGNPAVACVQFFCNLRAKQARKLRAKMQFTGLC